MEIRELNLVAFGPFTERTLVFTEEPGALHIVYGPNEAGKSSALRGLKAFLYGIDVRSTDNFIHAHSKLRIEGCLRASNGRELIFARRKGQKNTLLSMEGEPLDDKVLAPFLQAVTQTFFEMLFGIDHHALVQGGQEILEQKGEVGQALFSASLGSHALHAVLDRLGEEADGLFRPRGSTQTINLALKTYTDLNKEIRGQSLSSREWDDHCRTLALTTKELEKIQSELADKRTEVNRLRRIQRVLPNLARRRELLQKFEMVGDVIVLPDDFTARHQQALTERETAQAIFQKATVRLKSFREQLEGLSVRQEILEQNEIIEDLHARLGSHRKAMQDRPQLEAENRLLLTDAESLLKDIRPDIAMVDIDILRPAFAKRERITELGNQNSVLVLRVKQAKISLHETETRLAEACNEHQKFPVIDVNAGGSPDSLRRAIAAARKLGDLDSAVQSGCSELTTSQEQCTADLLRLTLWTGSLEDVPVIPVPNQESITQFEEAYDELDKRTQRLREKQEEISEALHKVSQRLDEIQRAGTVPTEEELIEIRAEREQSWQLLRRQWIDGEDVKTEASAIDTKRELPDAFEYRITGADELADRLRREADRVHSMASLLAEQGAAKQRAKEIEQQLNEFTAEKEQIDIDWKALWASSEIQPRTPREMRTWLADLEKLRERVSQLRMLRQQVSDLEYARDTQTQRLKQQLQSLGKESPDTTFLEAILLESEEVIDEIDDVNRQQAALAKEIKTLEHEQKSVRAESQSANSELDEWKTQWKEAVEEIGLKGDASPSEAASVIDKLRELFAKQREAKKLQIRLQAIDEDAVSFSGQVGSVVAKVAPEFAKLSAEEAVVRLNVLLSDSRARQSRHQQIEEQLQQAQQDVQDSEATIQTMTARLDALCMEAKRGNHAELEEAERSSAEYLRLKAEVANVEQELLDAGEGVSLAELEAEAKDVEPDALPGQIDALTSKIDEELEPKRTALAENKGREEKEIELMDGSDHAAALADQGQSVLASIRINAERYVRLKLAARILRDEIERYRKENQGPLVKRASEHFVSLTQGSFEGLRTDFTDNDEPVLAGIRSNGERVHVAGMSSGTRDQLYLALRLAALEKYMESSEPMPFIVDDILVHFDDGRSAATLGVLAELAKKTQVILFTHHSRLVEQARELVGSVAVVHEL